MTYFAIIKKGYPISTEEAHTFKTLEYARGYCDAWYGEYLHGKKLYSTIEFLQIINSGLLPSGASVVRIEIN